MTRRRFVLTIIGALALVARGTVDVAGSGPLATPANSPAVVPAIGLPAFTDVPEYRADDHRTGVYAGPGPEAQPVVVWQRTIDAAIGFNPLLADGMVLFGGDDKRFYALDARTGAERWSYAAGETVDGFGSVGGGLVVFGSGDGILHALDIATGAQRWDTTGVTAGSQPIGIGGGTDISDGAVYAPGADDHAYGFDLATGAVRWSWAAPANVAYVSVADGTAYVSVDDGNLYAVSVADGHVLWQVPTAAQHPGIPVIGPDTVYITAQVTTDAVGELYVVDRTSGKVQWTFKLPSGDQVSLGALSGGAFYAGSPNRTAFAFPTDTGAVGLAPAQLWVTPLDGEQWKNQALSSDTLYVPLQNRGPTRSRGGLAAISTADGTLRWTVDLADNALPQGILVSGGMVFVADETGAITAFAEPALRDAIGPTASGPLTATTAVPEPADPFTVVRTLEPATTGLRQLFAMTVGPDGLIYALDGKPSVTVIDPASGRVVRSLGSLGSGDGQLALDPNNTPDPTDIAVGADGRVYVGDTVNHRVEVFEPDGTFVRQLGTFGTLPGQFSRVWDVAVDPGGGVYAVDEDLHRMTKFDRDGALAWTFPPAGSTDHDLIGGTHSVTVLASGRLAWLTESGPVLIVDAATAALVDRWGQPGRLAGEIGGCSMTVDAMGTSYIQSCDPLRTQVFDASHQLIGGAYAPRDTVYIPVFGPGGAVYGHRADYADDSIVVLSDPLMTP